MFGEKLILHHTPITSEVISFKRLMLLISSAIETGCKVVKLLRNDLLRHLLTPRWSTVLLEKLTAQILWNPKVQYIYKCPPPDPIH